MNVSSILLSLSCKSMNFAFKIHEVLTMIDPRIWSVKRRMKSLPIEGLGKELYIILNGPSLKTQDLSCLKGKCLMFVNRGFMHPDFKALQPTYHTFIDSKLRDGEWPIEWVDTIFEMCPNIKILFPISWYKHPKFARFKHDKRIIWLHWHVPVWCLGACFSFGILHKFSSIFFTGFDANGCAYDMIKSSESHFYGSDPELSDMSTMQHANAMFSTSLQFYDLNRLAKYCNSKGISIVNLTNGGLLDMFERKQFIKLKPNEENSSN